AAGFDPLTTACRRGQIFEELGHNAQAVDEYQRALTLPLKPVEWPDPDETLSRGLMQQAAVPYNPQSVPAGPAALQADLTARLTRLYDALGQPEQAFNTMLRGMEVDPGSLNVGNLQSARTRAETLDRQDAFRAWLRGRIKPSSPADTRAAVYWVLGEYDACISALAGGWQPRGTGRGEPDEFSRWRERFAALGTSW
ncbi:MAG: hypothetical protein JJ992_00185, partial [Planctomycetes bacterium]|nr:hypothetical protein [Planctomycetota bacterium]